MRADANEIWASGVVQRIEPDQFSDILAWVSDLALVISSAGMVLNVLANPGFKPREKLKRFENVNLRETLTSESVPKFEARLRQFLSDMTIPRAVELSHSAGDGFPALPVRYSFHSLRDSDEILLLGRDLRPIAEMQQQLVAAQISLQEDFEARREHDTRFRVLMASIEEPVLFVSLPDGVIREANRAAQTILGKTTHELIGGSFAKLFADGIRGDVLGRIESTAVGDGKPEITFETAGARRAMTVTPTLFRLGGDQMLLCKLSRPASAPVQMEALQQNLTALFEKGSDAVAFVGAEGALLSVNDAFLNLTDVNHAQALKNRSLADFLLRGGVDLNVMLENAARSGVMRLYATRLISEYGSERGVEISTVRLDSDKAPIFAMIIRDVSRADAARSEGQAPGDVDSRSVIELIGSQSLRDIVAQTTDVVEKMCIETAVELTSNNRVAAAEMLGLSRQSLYVKLRKYGLLKSGDDV